MAAPLAGVQRCYGVFKRLVGGIISNTGHVEKKEKSARLHASGWVFFHSSFRGVKQSFEWSPTIGINQR
ncbi:hypothetical protein HanRHA438_Chr12g0545491 [Helianthus annuus]|nr:hypothetical protein HanRHA438_Chr12g0545491 [Helianthus annuus]